MKVERLTDEEIRVWRDQDALEFTDFVKGAREIIPRMLDEVEAARTLLRRIEWVAGAVAWNCPACGGAKDRNGHRADCDLAALIGKATLPKSADRP